MLRNFLFILALCCSGTVQAQSAQDIADRASAAAYYAGDSGKSLATFTITDAQGRKRTRQFQILRRNSGKINGPQKFYVYFTRPADLSRSALLVHKNVARSDDRWLYLPALDLVRRIAPSDKRTSFAGSHFFYEDISGRSPREDRHSLESSDGDYYVLRSVPKRKGVGFASYRSWIHRKSFVTVKVEYHDVTGQVYRRYSADKVKIIGGIPTVTRATMSDFRSGGKTTADFKNVTYGMGLPEKMFGEGALRSPPLAVLGG